MCSFAGICEIQRGRPAPVPPSFSSETLDHIVLSLCVWGGRVPIILASPPTKTTSLRSFQFFFPGYFPALYSFPGEKSNFSKALRKLIAYLGNTGRMARVSDSTVSPPAPRPSLPRKLSSESLIFLLPGRLHHNMGTLTLDSILSAFLPLQGKNCPPFKIPFSLLSYIIKA